MTAASNKDFREQLGKFRLDNTITTTNNNNNYSPPKSLVNVDANDGSNSRSQPLSSPQQGGVTGASPPQQQPAPPVTAPRSKRVSTACDFCRKRKKKCDFRYPNCSACTRAGVRCTIPPPGPQVASASVPRDQLEKLQKRVKWLEEVVRQKTGITIADFPTGSAVDGEGDPDWWYQVPSLVAGSNGSTAHSPAGLSSPPGSGTGSVGSPGTTSAGYAASETPAPAIGVELPNVGEIFRDHLEHRRPSAARPVPSSESRVLRLSSLEEAERVATRYFDSLGYQYPFLHRLEFMAQLRHIYASGVTSPETHYSYHITMATALLIGSSDETQAREFYRASQSTLSLALQNEDLSSVGALLSLALYTMFATAGPSVWHVLGAAMRLAISLGLHKARPSASLVEQEMAKRAFWSLYNLDRLISSTLGRPLGIADEDISVDLPGEFNDDWVEAPGESAMTIPLQVMRLRRIFSRVYRYLYSNEPRPSPGEITAMLGRFRQQLDDWRMAAPVVPSALLYSTSYYDYLYYTSLLLMYRPSPRNPAPDVPSIVTCFDSSIQVVRSYWDSYSVGKLKWIWLTLSQVYFAGITILWCLEQNARAVRSGHPLLWQPDQQMMHQGIQAIVVLLEEFGKRRAGVDRLAETFRGQSTMVLGQLGGQPEEQQHQETYQQQQQTTIPLPGPVPVASVLDDVLLVDGTEGVPVIDPQLVEQLFYSYDWFQEEMATYYTL